MSQAYTFMISKNNITSPPCLFLCVVEIQTIQRASFYDNVTSLDEPAGEWLGRAVADLGQNNNNWKLTALGCGITLLKSLEG